MSRVAALGLWTALGLGAAAAQSAAPIIVERLVFNGMPDTILMIGGQVKLPAKGKDGYLAVRSGPGATYAETDRLKAGATMILLGPNKPWRAVVYPDPAAPATDDMEKACGLPNPPPPSWPVKTAYQGPCRTGWVNMRFVEQLAD